MKRPSAENAPPSPDDPTETGTSQTDELGEQLLELMLEAEKQCADTPSERLDGVWVGRLVGFAAAEGRPLVSVAGRTPPGGVVARATTKLAAEDVGQDVALMFEEGDPERPIVMGLLRRPIESSAVHVEVDGERTVVSGEREIVLRCGEASITLTRAGKVLIRGEYVLTRSSGVNRIQGGSVQIN